MAGVPEEPGRMGALEARVVDLELRFMTIQREAEELSGVVEAQQRLIEALTVEAKRRREREREQTDDVPLADEAPPPHY